MKASRTRLAGTIADRTLKSGVDKKLAQEIAAYLLSEGRVSELNSVLRDVQTDWAKAGYVEVLAASAYALSSEVKANITKRVLALFPAAKQIVVTEVHDPSVVGGVRLNLANQQLDLSIRSKLNRFKQLTGR